MKAVILAAGEGNRMHPLTETQPKVMLPLANKPIIEHLLEECRAAGISEFVFVVGYHAETLWDYFGDGARWSVGITYVNQRSQLGTGHAVKLVQGVVDGPFLLANGDVIAYRDDIAKLVAATNTVMSVFEVPDPSGLGVVETSGDMVVRIHEKVSPPPCNTANAGIYLLTDKIFDAIDGVPRSPRGEYELTDALQVLIDRGAVVQSIRLARWLNLSFPWDLLDANAGILSSLVGMNAGVREDNVVVHGEVSIGKGSTVRSGSYIAGPVIIGDNCDIGPNCFIRAFSAIGNGCHIGASVEVKNSIIMAGTKVPHLSYVGDSIIAEGCNLGAGTKIANLRFDKREIAAGGVKTGRRKFGAVIGANVQTGINSSIDAGTLIGSGTFIGPGAHASGTILADSRIY